MTAALLGVAGALMVVAGVAWWAPQAGLVVAGLGLLAFALLWDFDKGGEG